MTETGGTYTLLIAVPEEISVTVGALGEHDFETGWYAYVGSALGSGGFARVDRHRDLAAGEHDARHWHVDYLLGHPGTRLDEVVTTAGVDGECVVSTAIDGEAVPDFGCSDCDCGSHLWYDPARERLRETVERAHEQIRG
jgi:Uri superfamily endonuclease